MEKTDIIIIGAGVVGLAVAFNLAQNQPGKSILVIERHESWGQETSSRSSEVIHAGIYYPAHSLKTRLCVRGRELLYEFLQEHAIPYKKTGKFIVATEADEKKKLSELYEQARANGVDEIQRCSAATVAEIEPDIFCLGALYSPVTGIFDSHQYMKALEIEARKNGALFAYGCELKAMTRINSGYQLEVIDADGSLLKLIAEVVINCAGLASDQVAAMAGIDIDQAGYRLHLSKGEYFRVQGLKRWYLKHLVYPVPGTNYLGIHTVLDLDGNIKLGPNAFYIERIDYTVAAEHREEFYQAASRYLPFLKPESLVPDMAGIRAKLQKPGEAFRDFVIKEESALGLPGFINCIGIESPGLTSSLAIGEYVNKIII